MIVKLNKHSKTVNQKMTFSNSKGQTFVEFILLMLVMVSLSFITLKGFNGAIAQRWLKIVQVIAKPSPSTIELP